MHFWVSQKNFFFKKQRQLDRGIMEKCTAWLAFRETQIHIVPRLPPHALGVILTQDQLYLIYQWLLAKYFKDRGIRPAVWYAFSTIFYLKGHSESRWTKDLFSLCSILPEVSSWSNAGGVYPSDSGTVMLSHTTGCCWEAELSLMPWNKAKSTISVGTNT